ncbi:MAG: prohibitin family protein [Synechococcaceae cyanobacterium SM2_3_1]|nr:prohibitin family protein [Synechococcaceae cyanobacterium SM2_3_1]
MTMSQVSRWLPQALVGGGILVVLLSTNPFRFVENGQNLVVFSWFSGVQSSPLQPGFHVITPVVTSTYPFDIKTRALTWKDQDATAYGPRLVSLSRDGQVIRSEVTLQFRVSDPARVFTVLGPDPIYEDRIAPIVRSVIASETAAFSAQALYSTERPVLQAQIRERLSTYLQEFGITVIDLLLRDVTFDPDFVAAIEAKTIAENQLAQKEFEIEEARQNARSTVAAAQGEAGRLEAKADALNQNPEYLNVVKSGVLGDTLDTLITE